MTRKIFTGHRGRAKYEWVIIAVILVAALFLALGIYTTRDKAKKGQLLLSELSQIRSAVTMYKTLNKANPPSLASLTKLTYSFEPGAPPQSYLNGVVLNEDQELIDPFGTPYVYDRETGWVICKSPGFQQW